MARFKDLATKKFFSSGANFIDLFNAYCTDTKSWKLYADGFENGRCRSVLFYEVFSIEKIADIFLVSMKSIEKLLA